jgi:uncharacterized membrane protein
MTMIVALLGAFKILAEQLFGVSIPNETIDTIANGLGAVVVVVGIFMTHTKEPKGKIRIP